MSRPRDWPTLRAEFAARGYDLNTVGLFGPPDYLAEEDAWEDWDRLQPLLQPSTEKTDWQVVEPHLPAIELAIAKQPGLQVEARSIRHLEGIEAAKLAARGLAAGALATEDSTESLRRLRLATRVVEHLAAGGMLLSVLLSVSVMRTIFEAAGGLVERGLPPDANWLLRETVSPLVLPPWRNVALAELRYSLGWIERASVGGESMERDLGLVTDDRQYDGIRRLAALMAKPDARERGLRDRARLKIGNLYARALLDPQVTDDFACLDRVAPQLEPSPWGMYSLDRVTREMASMSSGAWPALPRLYRSVLGYRRMILLASLARDLPPDAPFSDVLRLRTNLEEEGWDPFLRNPLRIVDEGDRWAFFANAIKEVAVVRIPRP